MSAARNSGSSSKLLQQPDVVLEELAEIGHPVFELGDPLDSHSEGEPLDPLRVVAVLPHEAVDVRIHHPGAQDLDPADPLAERIAGAIRQPSRAAAAEAGDIDLDARLGEREEARPEAGLALGPEGRSRELV